MKGMIRGVVVLTLALGVLACMQKVWRVAYTVEGNNDTYGERAR